MGVLSKLFGSRKPEQKGPSQHEVVVHFSYGSRNFQHVFALEDSLRIAIAEARVGNYDSHYIEEDGSEGFYYMYGPDAEKLLLAITPILEASTFMHGATVTLHFGPQKRGTPKRVIELP
jgi:hypothetical protein